MDDIALTEAYLSHEGEEETPTDWKEFFDSLDIQEDIEPDEPQEIDI